MKINETSIRKPISVLMLTLMVIVLGFFFLKNLSVDLLPRITYPLVRIMIDWKGASPLEIEENITKKVERSVATTEDAIKVVSKSMEGISAIDVYFDFGKNMDVALADTTAKLLQVRKEMPEDIIEPKIYKADPSQLPIMDIALYSKTRSEKWLRWWAENNLSIMFLGIKGLGAVVTHGGKVREIQVIFNNTLLQHYELSTTKLLQSLKQENLDSPAGRITSAKKEYSVRVLSKFKTVKDIENIILKNVEGHITHLKDVAKVIDATEEQRVITRFNGTPSVMLSFIKQPNANTVEIAQKIERRIKKLKKQKVIPADVNFSIASTQAYYINASVDNVSSSALIGGFLAMIVIFFFLHSIKRTFIIAVAIPVSILATFILMGLYDVTLNIFSLGGLVLAVGMLVDNSVVMLENITRYQHQGIESIEASRKGSGEILSALIASTLTTVTAMIPFFFIKGISALLFRDMVITIISALTVSLLVSFTLVPAMTARFFRKDKAVNPAKESDEEQNKLFMSFIMKSYLWLLRRVLKRKIIVPVILLILIIPGFFLFNNLGSIFLPKIDDGRIDIKVKMPTGTTLENTDKAVKKIEDVLKKVKGVKTTYAMIGGFWKSKNIFETANEATITIQLKNKNKRPWPTKKVMQFLRKNLKKLKKSNFKKAIVKVIPSKLRGIKKSSDSDIEIRLLGPDLDVLNTKANEIKKLITSVAGVINPDISIDISRPEIHVKLNRKKISDYGLTAIDISNVLRTSIYGMVDSYYTDKQLNMDFSIRLIRNPAELTDLNAIKNIQLYPPSGVDLRLYEVADVSIGKGPVQVDRENQVRIISVTADAGKNDPGKVFTKISEKLKNVKMAPGYRLEFGGEHEALKESTANLMIVIILGIFMVYVVMTVQYESLIDPLIILFTVPLAVIGAIVLLAITSTPFSIMVLLGLILLVGIVVNNAIIMVEFINEKKRISSEPLDERIIHAASVRLRPILMTTITTVIGMIPLALGLGEGLEMLQPLALTIAGGLSVSTLLTLFVIPVFYAAVYSKYKKAV